MIVLIIMLIVLPLVNGLLVYLMYRASHMPLFNAVALVILGAAPVMGGLITPFLIVWLLGYIVLRRIYGKDAIIFRPNPFRCFV